MKQCHAAIIVTIVIAVIDFLTGCETISEGMVESKEGSEAKSALKRLFPDDTFPSSARNIHTYIEHFPVGSVFIGYFEARTEELMGILNKSPHFPMQRQFFKSGEARDWLLKERIYLIEKCPWWKPEEAVCFGMVRIVKHYFDSFDDEDTQREFYVVTNYYAGLTEAGFGRSRLYIMVVWNEPEQRRDK